MSPAHHMIEFSRDALDDVQRVMDDLGESAGGWINLVPSIDEDTAIPRQSIFSMAFGTRVYEVPVSTWVPGEMTKSGRAPDSLGIVHPMARRALAVLRDAGMSPLQQWRTVQDHARRGLVVLAQGASHHDELEWLLGASEVLSNEELPAQWRAFVHLKRARTSRFIGRDRH